MKKQTNDSVEKERKRELEEDRICKEMLKAAMSAIGDISDGEVEQSELKRRVFNAFIAAKKQEKLLDPHGNFVLTDTHTIVASAFSACTVGFSDEELGEVSWHSIAGERFLAFSAAIAAIELLGEAKFILYDDNLCGSEHAEIALSMLVSDNGE